jgi:hypothetical protein
LPPTSQCIFACDQNDGFSDVGVRRVTAFDQSADFAGNRASAA